MSETRPKSLRSIPLGTLGTGSVEVCSDGRFRNISINNNRTLENRIPIAPHSFLAVRAVGGGARYVRRLQTEVAGAGGEHLLDADGLYFRGHFPQADLRVQDPGAPLEVVLSAFAPVVPYDYDASSLPLFYLGMQVTNSSEARLDVSTLLNWQNCCGCSALNSPEQLPSVVRDTLITQADWERMKGGGASDNERRLSSKTGHIESHQAVDIRPGDVAPNALVYGDAHAIDANEDGQYCVTTPWNAAYRTSLRVWDPENPDELAAFWKDFSDYGIFEGDAARDRGTPRAGAVCNHFSLEPGQSRSVEFVVSWYCPRYVVGGQNLGNFYANNHVDARAIARLGLTHGKYYFAAINGWQQRLSTSDLPSGLVKRLLAGSQVLSTNTIHDQNGQFGLFESPGDPRVNFLRDRWFWSMGLLLFYPRLELDILDRLSQRMLEEGTRNLRISEGLEGFTGGEFVAPGAAQVEACAHLVTMAWRNFLFGGNLSSLARLAPRLQGVMAVVMAQDRDFDGFPDLQDEAPGLCNAFASGFNVISAGLWLVALAAGERMARKQKLAEAGVYKKALERASRTFERYFWNTEYGYYTLYPAPQFELASADELQAACHVGQLHAIWIADLLGLGEVFPARHVTRALEAVNSRNFVDGRLHMISYPGTDVLPEPGWGEDEGAQMYNLMRFACCKLQQEPGAPMLAETGALFHCLDDVESGHVSPLALWYLILASPAAQLDLAEKRLNLRPDIRQRGQKTTHTLYTPNGFGAVSIQVSPPGIFECQVEFRMDIPQEITCIAVVLPDGLKEVACSLEMDDGPVALNVNTFVTAQGTRVEVFPEVKLSATAFTLQLTEESASGRGTASKTQWIPRWLRR